MDNQLVNSDFEEKKIEHLPTGVFENQFCGETKQIWALLVRKVETSLQDTYFY